MGNLGLDNYFPAFVCYVILSLWMLMDVDVFLKCNSDVNIPRNFEVCMKMVFFF